MILLSRILRFFRRPRRDPAFAEVEARAKVIEYALTARGPVTVDEIIQHLRDDRRRLPPEEIVATLGKLAEITSKADHAMPPEVVLPHRTPRPANRPGCGVQRPGILSDLCTRPPGHPGPHAKRGPAGAITWEAAK